MEEEWWLCSNGGRREGLVLSHEVVELVWSQEVVGLCGHRRCGVETGGGGFPEVRCSLTAFISGYLPCPQCCPEKSSRSMAQNMTPRREFFFTTLSIL